MKKTTSLFENHLSVAIEEISFSLNRFGHISWSEFLLNPRRLRGSDFLMRWSQGSWGEERLIEAINSTNNYYAMPYGPSSVAPDDVREFELYFERLDEANITGSKRPDLLVFAKKNKAFVEKILNQIGGEKELPFIPESNNHIKSLLSKSLVAIECENSLWVAKKMRDYNKPLKPMRRLGGKRGLAEKAVTPTIIIKDEDMKSLGKWQKENNKKIHIWHTFYDMAFGISLDEAKKLVKQKRIIRTDHTYQAPGGQTTIQAIYRIYHHYSYLVGESLQAPKLKARSITDKNGHILPYVVFSGGQIKLSDECTSKLSVLGK